MNKPEDKNMPGGSAKSAGPPQESGSIHAGRTFTRVRPTPYPEYSTEHTAVMTMRAGSVAAPFSLLPARDGADTIRVPQSSTGATIEEQKS